VSIKFGVGGGIRIYLVVLANRFDLRDDLPQSGDDSASARLNRGGVEPPATVGLLDGF